MNTLTILINLLEIIIVRKEYIEGERAWREEGEKEWVRERKTETEMERESERQRRGRKGERGELTKAYQKKITTIIIIDCHYFSVTVGAGKEGDSWESEEHLIF